jgi:iron complex transport system ATP-binding protein
LLRELSGQGLLVVAATHDLNLASAYSSRVVALRAGRVVADAPPGEVFVPGLIREVFSVDTRVIPGDDGRPRIVYGD